MHPHSKVWARLLAILFAPLAFAVLTPGAQARTGDDPASHDKDDWSLKATPPLSSQGELPTLELGVLDFPTADRGCSKSVGLKSVWQRFPGASPFLGAGLSFAYKTAETATPSRPGLSAAPWVGGGLELRLPRGGALGLGLSVTGGDRTRDGARRRGGSQAGLRFDISW